MEGKLDISEEKEKIEETSASLLDNVKVIIFQFFGLIMSLI